MSSKMSHEEVSSSRVDPSSAFPVWRTIEIGTGFTDTNEFSTTLTGISCRMSDIAKQLLAKTALAKEPATLNLARVSVAELGFKDGAYLRDVYVRAEELGLVLLPGEAGLQLRLAYRDQPLGEWLVLAMEPITDAAGNLHLYSIERGAGGLFLGTDFGFAAAFWIPDDLFAFACR